MFTIYTFGYFISKDKYKNEQNSLFLFKQLSSPQIEKIM